MFSRVTFSASLLLLAGWVQPALAAEPSGQAVAVRQDASASGPGGNRVIEVNGSLFAGDVIKTDRNGSAQILFADDTKMVVGPNSQVTIDAFVYKTKTTASAVSINALRGTFRFITGASAKSAYKITTPTATIGVRGTALDGRINDDGTITLAMWDGAINLCGGGVCYAVSGTCSIVILTPLEEFTRINNVYQRTNILDQLFPFAFGQGWLQAAFRVESRGCNIRDYSQPTSEGSNPDAPPEDGGGDGGEYQ